MWRHGGNNLVLCPRNSLGIPVRNSSHVIAFHDLHIWALSTTETALSVHLVVDHFIIENEFLDTVQTYLHDEFGIVHSTIQLETYTESKMYYDADCT